jgi:hypothetical protein
MANRISRPRGTAAGLLLAVILLTPAGCGPGVCDVSGRITYHGKPVVCGSVLFVGPDGITKVVNLNPDGTYLVKGVGVGRAQVGVVSQDPARPLDPYKADRTHGKEVSEPVSDTDRDPNAGRVFKNPPNDRSNWTEPTVDRSKWFPLPQKYEMVHTSGLTTELKRGLNEGVDFDLQ